MTLMDRKAADQLQADHGRDARSLYRRTKAELERTARWERAQVGIERIFGTSSKNELIAEILELRGYTIAKLNEASHVLHHIDGWTNSACKWCPVPQTFAEHTAAAVEAIATASGIEHAVTTNAKLLHGDD